MIASLRSSLILIVLMTGLLGGVYPALIWVFGNIFFPEKANASLIIKDNKVVGSSLIGQQFESDRYFWGRLSATTPTPYNAQNSGSNHLNADHPELLRNAQKRLEALNHEASTPVDLVTNSGSGLDPHISPAAAAIQVARIAKSRNIDPMIIRKLIQDHTEPRSLGVLGEPRINVLLLNLALDKIMLETK